MTTTAQYPLALPQSQDSTRAIFGCILLDESGACRNQALAMLDAEDFPLDSDRRLFQCIVTLADRQVPVDYATLTEELQRRGELEAIGGVGYLASLTEGLPRLSNIEHYARIVKDRAAARRLAHAGTAITADALDATEPTEDKISRATERILDIANERAHDGPVSIEEIFTKDFGSLDAFAAQGRTKPGLSTGFLALDQLVDLQPGQLVLLAARPSMGKTSLALNMTLHVGLLLRKPVLFFSLEMSRADLLTRMACALARVNIKKLKGDRLESNERKRLVDALSALIDAPIKIDDSPELTLTKLRAKTRRYKQEGGLGLLIVDYLGLMTAPKAENRNQEISRLSRGLKLAAREIGAPLIALSQLSRAPELRGTDHRPQLSDLRDSGSLEQDSDVAMLMWSADYYLRTSGKQQQMDATGITEVIVAKQRSGPTGSVSLVFQSEWASFAGMRQGA